MLSGNEALSLMLDSNMTKAAFQLHRNTAIAKQFNLYPAYNNIKSSKLLCYPNNMIFIDYTASIPLQNLCDHLAQRLYQVQNDVLCIIEKRDLVLLHYKAGFDGSAGQMSVNILRDLKKEKSLFLTYLVPLQITISVRETQTVIWRNPKPSSTLY